MTKGEGEITVNYYNFLSHTPLGAMSSQSPQQKTTNIFHLFRSTQPVENHP